MIKRTVNITVTFDLPERLPNGATVTSKETCEELVKNNMIDMFSWEEGFQSVEVTVTDE